MIRAVREAGAREVLVTGGAGAAETEEVLEVAGVMDVLREEGVELHDHNRPPFTEVGLDYDGLASEPQPAVMVNERVLGYERLVVVSQLKLHENARSPWRSRTSR